MTSLRPCGKPAGPHCKAPASCPAHPKSTHCKPCDMAARWREPGRREAVGPNISAGIARNGRPPFKDELKVRRAVLYAGAFGLNRAGEMLGLCPKKISHWRCRLEKIDGKAYPRLPAVQPKLSREKAEEIRAHLCAGEKYEYLAHIYGVSPTTIGRINSGRLYPPTDHLEAKAAA